VRSLGFAFSRGREGRARKAGTRAGGEELDAGFTDQQRVLPGVEVDHVRGVLVRLERGLIGIDLVEDAGQRLLPDGMG